MKYPLYRFVRNVTSFYIRVFYRIDYINKENIPKTGPFILAGNHKNNLDFIAVMSSTKETIHFLAKKELLQRFGILFKKIGAIAVDRSKKNKEAITEGENILKNGGVIGIFPEGTFNKSEYIILPFKYGAVKMAIDTNAMIVPFAIVGEYKLFRKKIKIVFGKAYNIKEKSDLKSENIRLMNKVIKLLGSEDEK